MTAARPPARRLVSPTTGLRATWRAARADWGPGVHEDGFGIGPDDDVDSDAGFATWVAGLRAAPDATLWWIVVDPDGRDEAGGAGAAADLVGGIALRHPVHPAAARHGHVGYGVRPGARGRGHASWALARVLEIAAARHGMDHADLVCEQGNRASARLIEKLGGRATDRPHPGVVRYRVGCHAPRWTGTNPDS